MNLPRMILIIIAASFPLMLSAEEGEFPVVGKTYHIRYISQPEGFRWPIHVKILKRGSGLWCEVEDVQSPERSKETLEAGRRVIDGNSQRIWLNFGEVLGAQEE